MGTIARRGIAKPTLAAAATALAAFGLLWAGPAKAGTPVQIGQLSPGDPDCGGGPFNIVQSSVGGAPSYTVPSAGTITSWSHRGRNTDPGTGRLQVWRAAGGTNYTLVGRSVLRAFVAGQINTFATDIPVAAGDLLGLRSNEAGCGFPPIFPGEDILRADGAGASDAAPGETRNMSLADGSRLNVSATLDPTDTPPPPPSNDFSFGKLKKNKKKGTAKLTVKNLSGPGQLELAKNKKVKPDTEQVEAAAAGAGQGIEAKLGIKARGKGKKKLNRNGKVKVKAEVTYTPDGGEPNTKSKRFKLKKR